MSESTRTRLVFSDEPASTRVPLPFRGRFTADADGPAPAPAPSPAPAPAPAAVPAAAPAVVTASHEPATVPAAPSSVAAAAPTYRRAGEFILDSLRAQRGEPDAFARVERVLAAAGDLDTVKEAGLVPPSYASRIIGDVDVPRPIYANCVAHESLWSTGLKLELPKITDWPEGGWIAAEGGVLPTDDMSIAFGEVAVKFWGHAVKMSLPLVMRSNPAAVETYYRLAVRDFWLDVEADLHTAITGAAAASGITATDPSITALFDMAAELGDVSSERFPATADVALCGAGVWAALMSTAVVSAPAFSSGAGDAAPGVGNVAGIRIVYSPKLASGDMLVGDSTAVRAYGGDGTSERLTALVVGSASVQHGVYAEFARNVENTAGWLKHTFTGTRVVQRAAAPAPKPEKSEK